MRKKLISVVVPIYNVEKYLSKCIESILKQTYAKLEIILVDDGSPDSCGNICDEYARKDERIKVIHKKNGGLSDARNVAIDIAKGQYICFIDSDDYIHPQYVESLYNIVQESGADVSVCNYITYTWGEEISIEKINQTPKYEEICECHLYDDDFLNKERVKFVIAWNKLYKTALFDGIRYPIGAVHEDNYTTYKLLDRANKVMYTETPLYYYLMREQSISHANGFNENRFHILKATDEEIEFFHKKDNQRMVEILVDSFLFWMWNCINDMKKEGLSYSEKMKPYRKMFRKYLFYLKVTKSCKINKICKYIYIAYLKKI